MEQSQMLARAGVTISELQTMDIMKERIKNNPKMTVEDFTKSYEPEYDRWMRRFMKNNPDALPRDAEAAATRRFITKRQEKLWDNAKNVARMEEGDAIELSEIGGLKKAVGLGADPAGLRMAEIRRMRELEVRENDFLLSPAEDRELKQLQNNMLVIN